MTCQSPQKRCLLEKGSLRIIFWVGTEDLFMAEDEAMKGFEEKLTQLLFPALLGSNTEYRKTSNLL